MPPYEPQLVPEIYRIGADSEADQNEDTTQPEVVAPSPPASEEFRWSNVWTMLGMMAMAAGIGSLLTFAASLFPPPWNSLALSGVLLGFATHCRRRALGCAALEEFHTARLPR